MARPRKKEGISGAEIAVGIKKMMGGKKAASKAKAKAPKRTATTKAAATKRAKSPVAKAPAKVKRRVVMGEVFPKSIKNVIARTISTPVAQTKTGKRQDRKFIALPAGKRRASKVSIITKADGTTFKRRNPRAKAGNIYMEKRANRADKFGKVARRGGKM